MAADRATHYCMNCDGVIPFTPTSEGPPPENCPHCGTALDDRVKAMFNWVEIDEAPGSDAAVLGRVALIGFGVLVLVSLMAWWVFS